MELSFGQSPTVNGQFYGDGDNNIYELWATGSRNSKIYAYFPVPGGDPNLYVALVVNRDVNDNAFANFGSATATEDEAYMRSADWEDGSGGVIKRKGGQLIDSEQASFTLTCKDGSSWTWVQDYISAQSIDGSAYTTGWESAPTSAFPPHSFQASSAMAWNLNNYAQDHSTASPATRWDITNGTGNDDGPGHWKSPFEDGGASESDVTEVDGYPDAGDINYSSTYEWEWSMVYEWKVDLASACGSSAFEVLNGSAHHSPDKPGPTETFDDPGDFADWGDLPDRYNTLSTNNGARHLILASGNPYLGSVVDADPEGVPTTDTKGDDVSDGADDEDGVTFLDPLIPGETARIEVVAGTAGFLSAFIDFDNDGVLETVTFTSVSGPTSPTTGTLGDTQLSAGTYTFTINVPSDASNTNYSRFRFTQNAGEGGNSTTGEASNGEVEDYKTVSLVVTGGECYRTLSVPYQDGIYDDLVKNLWTQGVTGSDHPGGPDSNVYVWDTSTSGSTGGWTTSGINLASAPVGGSGTGFLLSVYDDDDFNGVPDGFSKGMLLPTNRTAYGSSDTVSPTLNSNANGWTLVGNPFGDPVLFSALGKTGLTNVGYVYDRNAGGTTTTDDGTTTVNGGWISTSSGDGLGDIDGGIIATLQGFFVQNDGSSTHSLTFENADRTTGGTFYGKETDGDNRSDFVRLELNGETLYNSAWISFPDIGSRDRVKGDAYKLYPYSEHYALMASVKGDELFDIGQFPDQEGLEIPLHIEVTRSEEFTLTATDLKLTGDKKLLFVDTQENVTLPIDESFEYRFTLDSAPRKDALAGLSSCGANGQQLTEAMTPKMAKTSGNSSGQRFVIRLADAYQQPEEIPSSVTLHQNYPNPFNPTTQIAFELPQKSEVRLDVYDLTGRQVATLVNDVVSSGSHSVPFNASNLSSGVYIYKLNVGSTVITKKLTLIK